MNSIPIQIRILSKLPAQHITHWSGHALVGPCPKRACGSHLGSVSLILFLIQILDLDILIPILMFWSCISWHSSRECLGRASLTHSCSPRIAPLHAAAQKDLCKNIQAFLHFEVNKQLLEASAMAIFAHLYNRKDC